MEIKKTTFDEISQLNQIISRSKSFWNYDQDYLKAAIPLIQITEAWLLKHEGYTLREDKDILGFIGIEIFDSYWKLEHLWIDLKKIRKGYGRKSIHFLCQVAREQKITKILILPDPPAENFYLNLGAEFTGKKIVSRIPNGPIFQEMIFIL